MPSVFERYALGRRPVPGRGRGRSSPPKKPGKKKPQPAWNGYLTDSARYKLPLKEQERRKNNYNFCGPVQPKLSPKKQWHRKKRVDATPERRPQPRASSAATEVDVFDLLAEGDAVVDTREEEAPPTVERRATVRRLFGPKRKAVKKKPVAKEDTTLSIRVADLEERLARSEARAARFASQLDAMSQTVDALQARDLARAATRTPPPAPTTTPPPPSTPPPPPVVTARRSLEALDLKIGRDGSVVDDFLAAREATGVCPDSPEPPREPPAPTSAPPPPPPLDEGEAPAPPPRRVKLSGWTAAALDAGPPPAPARPRAPSLLSDDDDDRVMPIW